MIGTYEIRCHAAKPQMPLSPMFAFKDSPSSLRLLEIPKKIGQWNITTVKVAVNYPDNTSTTYTASRNGNVWVVTFNGCSITGKVANGLEVLADGIDENGDAVNGYVLGIGDIYILDRDADIEEAVSKSTMKYCDVMPETPVTGDVFIGSGAVEIYDGTQWVSIDIDLSEYATKSEVETTASTLDSKIDSTKTELESSIAEVASDIPTTTSELTNDSGFITSASVPTKTSDLTNDSGYITSTQVEPYNPIRGYAKSAQSSLFLFGRSSAQVPDETHFVTIDFNVGKLCYSGLTYYPWQLSMYDGTTFDPPLEMVYGYRTTVGYKVNGRVRNIGVNSNCWLAIQTVDSRNTMPYYIKAVEDDDGYIIPDYNLYVATVAHPITFDEYKRSIETIDGVAGNITCTRQSTGTYTTEFKYFPFEDQLPTKVSDLTNDAGYLTTVSWNDVQDKPSIPTKTSDLTNDSDFTTNTALNNGLALKQDKLSVPQINSINSDVDDNKTVVYYDNIEPRSYDIYGTMNIDDIRVEGSNITGVKIGRGVKTLGTELFMNSPLMTSIELPDSLKSIGVNVFTTSNIDSLVVPDSVETINAYAFSLAHTVSITVGSGVETIGQGAFDNCDNLTSVVFKGKTLAEVQAMENYPWGITDTSIIKTWNEASQEQTESNYLPRSGGTLSGTLNAQNVYGNQFTSNSDCQTGGGQTYTSFGNNGILMGRSPDVLRVLWPFNTSLGNNQTFATQEWVLEQIAALRAELQGGN